MNADYRMQQECEEERHTRSIETLLRIKRGLATESDALFLASELGLLKEFCRETEVA